MSWFRPQYPKLVVSFSESRVAAVKLAAVEKRTRLAASAIKPLPRGAFESSMIKPNIRDPQVVYDTLKEALTEVRPEDNRVSLLLPDKVARVSLLPVQQLPPKRSQALEIIHWKLKKTIPFKIDDAVMDYHLFGESGKNGETAGLLVITAMKMVLRQYEELLAEAGLAVKVTDLSIFNLFNLYHDAIACDIRPTSDAMLVNVDDSCFTIAIFQGSVPRLLRTKSAAGREGTGVGARLVLSEVHPSLLYYRDRLKGQGIQRAYVRSGAELFRTLEPELRPHFPLGLEWIHPQRVLGPRGLPELNSTELQILSPLIGLGLGR